MPSRARHLSARSFLFSAHAIQRLRERVSSSDLDSMSDDSIEDELDRRLPRSLKGAARFRDADGVGLAVEVAGLAPSPFTVIVRGDTRGQLRVVSTVIGRPLLGLLEFWLREDNPERQILSAEYSEPRLLRWEEGGVQHLDELPALLVNNEVAQILARGVPTTSISLWRPERITISVGVAKPK
jgi:hypothetical protein